MLPSLTVKTFCLLLPFYLSKSEEVNNVISSKVDHTENDDGIKAFKGSVYYDNLKAPGGIENTTVFLYVKNGTMYWDTYEYLQCKIMNEMSRQLLRFMSEKPMDMKMLMKRDNIFNYWRDMKTQCVELLFDYYNRVTFRLWHTLKYKSKVLRHMGGGKNFENKTRKQIIEHWYAEDKYINTEMNRTILAIRNFMRENIMTWLSGPYRICTLV